MAQTTKLTHIRMSGHLFSDCLCVPKRQTQCLFAWTTGDGCICRSKHQITLLCCYHLRTCLLLNDIFIWSFSVECHSTARRPKVQPKFSISFEDMVLYELAVMIINIWQGMNTFTPVLNTFCFTPYRKRVSW